MDRFTNDTLALFKSLFQKKERFEDVFTVTDLVKNKVIKEKELTQKLPLIQELINNKIIKGKKNGFSLTPKASSLYKEILEEANNTYTDEYRDSLEEEVKKYKKFIITTAVLGKEVNLKFAKAIKNYARRNNALALVIPCEDVVSRNRKAKLLNLDESLKDFKVVFKDLKLSNKLLISAIRVSAKQIDPLTGLDRIATELGSSVIVGATKRFMRYIPNQHYELPLALMTTGGAVTVDNYDTDRYMSKRTTYIAECDHTYGAVVVELEESGYFHFRHVTATPNGSFTDLGVVYDANGSINFSKGTDIVLGDSHVGYHSSEILSATSKLMQEIRVNSAILHDIFNGTSITHHDIGKNLEKARKATSGKSILKVELNAVKSYLKEIKKQVKKVVIVDSNHDNHLYRYLNEGRFMQDPINMAVGLELSLAVVKGKNPLEFAITEKLELKDSDIKWLKTDESYKSHGVELSLHGHRGANGGKGSLTTFDKCVGNCVTAHTHTAAICRDAFSVGTSTGMDMGYNEGLSNWTNTCCLVYADGTKQLITFAKVNNKYKYTLGE